jgi:hypothetical protein
MVRDDGVDAEIFESGDGLQAGGAVVDIDDEGRSGLLCFANLLIA